MFRGSDTLVESLGSIFRWLHPRQARVDGGGDVGGLARAERLG